MNFYFKILIYFLLIPFINSSLTSIKWIEEFAITNTELHCFDDRDCQNIKEDIYKLIPINMDNDTPAACKLNRCLKTYNAFKHFCETLISPKYCQRFCGNQPNIIKKNNINDCCLCLNVKKEKKLAHNECKRQNSDINTNIKGNLYCENDFFKVDWNCVDNIFCHETCNSFFDEGIFGNCDNGKCICYRKAIKTNEMKKNKCDKYSKKLNVSTIYINNLCLYSNVKNLYNKCNKYNCKTLCDNKTGKCFDSIIHL